MKLTAISAFVFVGEKTNMVSSLKLESESKSEEACYLPIIRMPAMVGWLASLNSEEQVENSSLVNRKENSFIRILKYILFINITHFFN